MNRRVVIIAITLLLLGGGWYWSKQSNTVEKEVIKIGAILPLSGNAAVVGEKAKNGLLFSEIIINDSILKDSKYKVKFILEDGQAATNSSLSSLNKLLSTDKCEIIFSIVSPVDLAILPIQKLKNFLFISHATHPKLSNVNELVFRHSPTVLQEFELLDKEFENNWKDVIFIYSNDDYGSALNGIINKSENRCKSFAIQPNTEIDKFFIQRIIKEKPNNIVISATSKIGYQIIKTIKENGYNGLVFTTLGFSATGGKELISNEKNVKVIDFDFEINKTEPLSIRFQSQFKSELTPTEIIFFNSSLLIGKAIAEGNIKPINIASNIKSNPSVVGLMEDIKINTTNDILPRIKLKENINGIFK